MALDPSRANQVKAAAMVLWSHLVPFCIEHRHDYLGMPCVGKSHRGTPPQDDETVSPSGQDDSREDNRQMMNLEEDPGEPPILVPHRYPTHKMIYNWILERDADHAATCLQLYNRCELTGPIPLDHRGRGHPNDVGFYVTLDVVSATDGKTWRIQQAKAWGDPDWVARVEAQHSDMGWKVVD